MASMDLLSIALCLGKTVFAWLVLAVVGANVIGLIVRCLVWSPPVVDGLSDRAQEVLAQQIRYTVLGNGATLVSSIVFAGAYLFALFHFWNIHLALAAGILMVARIPDLMWEIRTGKKSLWKNRPKGAIYTIATVCQWAVLLLIWYSFCR